VARSTLTQLCRAAKDLGFKEGRELLQTEFNARQAVEKLAAERKAALTAAGLPLPEAEASAILAVRSVTTRSAPRPRRASRPSRRWAGFADGTAGHQALLSANPVFDGRHRTECGPWRCIRPRCEMPMELHCVNMSTFKPMNDCVAEGVTA